MHSLANGNADGNPMSAREVREGAALKWYRGLSLAGLTDTLADSQLFGVGLGRCDQRNRQHRVF